MLALLITFSILFLLFAYSLTLNATLKYLRVRDSKDTVKRSYAFNNFFECIILSAGMTLFFGALVYANI